MYPFVVALHVVLCLILIGVILLQPGKGADPGSAFGGGMSSAVFGPRGPANLLSRATTAVAVLFMVTSVTLAFYSSKRNMGLGGDVESEIERQLREQQERNGAEEAPAPEGTPSLDVPGEIVPAGEPAGGN